MKKNYLKPESISLNVLCENVILSNSNGNDNDIFGGGDDKPLDANESRGEWKNVWNN